MAAIIRYPAAGGTCGLFVAEGIEINSRSKSERFSLDIETLHIREEVQQTSLIREVAGTEPHRDSVFGQE
jgi:hypothetical protein